MSDHEPHYTALGRMLVMFQSLEATITQDLALVLNSEISSPSWLLAQAAVSELSFASASRLASLLPSIYTAERIGCSSPENGNRLEDALADCARQLVDGLKLAHEAEQRRNQLVHSFWFIGTGIVNEPGTLMRVKTKAKARSLTVHFEQESIADIDENTEKAREAQRLIGLALGQYRFIASYQW